MAEAYDDYFYEAFWADERYTLEYAFDSAVRDRYPAIRRVWGNLRKPGRVLDFGCGNGVLTNWMFENGFGEEIVGVDVSETGIATARQLFEKPGLSFQVAPGGALGTLNNFDVVVASHVLEHVPHPHVVLGSLVTRARWFIFEVPLEDCLSADVRARLTGREQEENPVGHVNFWTRDTFRSLLEDAGYLIAREHQYASAPFSPYTRTSKRVIERAVHAILGTRAYGRLLSTHYTVLAWRPDSKPAAER